MRTIDREIDYEEAMYFYHKPNSIELQKRMEQGAEFLKVLIEELTHQKPLDKNQVYYCLSELCGALNIDDEFPMLSIERAKNPLIQILGA